MFTPQDRQEMIEKAKTSGKKRGVTSWPYMFSVFPKKTDRKSDRPHNLDKSRLTLALANVIYTKNPRNRFVSLGFYYSLVERISMHPELGHHIWKNISVVMKGSNAYAYLTKFDPKFPLSDLDIAIYIDPNVPVDKFDSLRRALHIVVLQVMSSYKRRLDDMFMCTNTSIKKTRAHDHYMNQAEIDDFKRDLDIELKIIHENSKSPFDLTSEKRNSFILTDSINTESTVKIELPHFEYCETIPLKRSPFVCSVNETINFKRDTGGTLNGSFKLYRIKLVCMVDRKVSSADFIDLTISSQDDAELISFWDTERYKTIRVRDPYMNVWPWPHPCGMKTMFLTVPDIKSCMNDLYNMLHVYQCPEHKRSKRVKRLEDLQKFV